MAMLSAIAFWLPYGFLAIVAALLAVSILRSYNKYLESKSHSGLNYRLPANHRILDLDQIPPGTKQSRNQAWER